MCTGHTTSKRTIESSDPLRSSLLDCTLREWLKFYQIFISSPMPSLQISVLISEILAPQKFLSTFFCYLQVLC